ncbi:MAG: pyrroline-5-carboxylate reductase [Candidatus Omnitrophota bacterium]
MNNNNVGMIGAGNMGEALIRGLKKQNKFNIYVTESNLNRLKQIVQKYKVKKIELEQLTNLCKIIIICVKPQDLDSVMSKLESEVNSQQTVISIVAGVSTKFIEKSLKSKPAVIRVMPNMPGMIGAGISGYCSGKYVKANTAKLVHSIFSGLGKVVKVQESKMNAITAVSGSGPGFYAYITDAMIEAGQKSGLSKNEAKLFAVTAMVGTGSLLAMESALTPSEYVKKVASKGGTTEAGLKIFKKTKLKEIVKKVIKAATKKAKELNREKR